MAFNEVMTAAEVAALSPLNLAFVGDAVWSLLVRTRLVSEANRSTHALNKASSDRVCAVKQSADYYQLLPHLSEVEVAVMKRGRNANPTSKAKNATVAEYRNATGLECLIGYLYLNGENARLVEIFNICWSENDEK